MGGSRAEYCCFGLILPGSKGWLANGYEGVPHFLGTKDVIVKIGCRPHFVGVSRGGNDRYRAGTRARFG